MNAVHDENRLREIPSHQNAQIPLKTGMGVLDKKISLYGVAITALFFGAACPHFLGYDKPWWLSPMLAAAVFLIVYLKRYNSTEPRRDLNRVVGSFFASRAVIPYAAALVLAACLIMLGISVYDQITRPISTFLQYGCIALMVYALIWEYGSRAIDRVFYILCVICVFQFTCGILLAGPSQVVDFLRGSSVGGDVGRYFELHDICLIMPLIAIYYARVAKDDRCRWVKVMIALAISLIGGKRIALAALVVVYVISLSLKFGKARGIQVVEPIVQTALVAAACVWIYITSTDIFAQLCAQLGIRSMGRTTIYEYFQQFVSDGFLSVGLGPGFCGLQLESLIGTRVLEGVNGVLGVHNDLLKVYIECGSIGFIALIVYHAIYFPIALGKRFGGEAKTFYYLAFTYALITYMTDNTMNYIVFQTVLYLVLVPRTLAREEIVVSKQSTLFNKSQSAARSLLVVAWEDVGDDAKSTGRSCARNAFSPNYSKGQYR